jgi:hypothetical protein
MLWLGGDAGEADVINQFPDETGLIIPQIKNYFFHAHDTEAGGGAGYLGDRGGDMSNGLNELNQSFALWRILENSNGR